MLYGPIFVADVEKDFDAGRSRSSTATTPTAGSPARAGLPGARAGPSSARALARQRDQAADARPADYTDEYNAWLASIPNHIYPLVFIIKRFYRPEWGDDWRALRRRHHQRRPRPRAEGDGRKLVGTYLRVGLRRARRAGGRSSSARTSSPPPRCRWRTTSRASVVVPARAGWPASPPSPPGIRAYKFAENCEYRLFQRPDDAIHRGLDQQTEADLARPDNFLSNFEPLDAERGRAPSSSASPSSTSSRPPMREHVLRTPPRDRDGYVVCSANPRLVDGKPTKNPRYLQTPPGPARPARPLRRRAGRAAAPPAPARAAAAHPGRARCCRAGGTTRPSPAGSARSAVYGPIHYQELPELFMDFICSLTGKSPSHHRAPAPRAR